LIGRKRRESGWVPKINLWKLTVPGVKIIHHVLVYGPKGFT